MKTIITQLMRELHSSMQKKLALLWPKKGGWFPPEANITYEIAKLGSKYGYEVFGECDIGRGRADMILLHCGDKWICHVECKLVNSDTCRSRAVIGDLERVSKPDGIDYLLHKVNASDTTNNLSDYEKYGLFVGADVSWMYSWWNATAGNAQSKAHFIKKYPHENKQDRINELLHFQKQSIAWGVVPRAPKEGEYWIVYGFFQLH